MKCPLAKIIGSHFKTFVPEGDIDAFNKLIKNGWQQEAKGELNLLTCDNELIPFLISLTTIPLQTLYVSMRFIISSFGKNLCNTRTLRNSNPD